MEINCLTQIYEMCFLLYLIISIYIIQLYLDKKFKKRNINTDTIPFLLLNRI